MFSDKMTRDGRPADVRPKRRIQPPAWLEDYEVALPHYGQQSQAAHAFLHHRELQARHIERVAEMTPLMYPSASDEAMWAERRAISSSPPPGPRYESTPVVHPVATEDVSEILKMMQQLRRENQQLQSTVLDMQQQMGIGKASSIHQRAEPSRYDMARLPSSRAPVPEHEDWPLPPPPVVDDDISPPIRDVPPPPPRHNVSDMVEELTTKLRRLQNKEQTPSGISTPEYCEPEMYPMATTPQQRAQYYSQSRHPQTAPTANLPSYRDTGQHPYYHQQEKIYRGPTPTIPDFTKGDPREFARLKISLDNLLPEDATERFKYQVLLEHLKFEDALLIADSYINSCKPYSDTMASLAEQYGQPHQLALRRIADLMDDATIRSHDASGFKRFALRVRALVGMLDQLGDSGRVELQCGSHVTRLLSKLPHDLRADFKRYMYPLNVRIPTLLHFADWLEYELKIQESGFEFLGSDRREHTAQKRDRRLDFKSTKTMAIFHSADPALNTTSPEESSLSVAKPQDKPKMFCPYCTNTQHYLNQCHNFSQLTKDQKTNWVKTNKRCWRCGRSHQAAQCRLKNSCKVCKGKHLEALHELNERPVNENTCLVNKTNDVLYLDRPLGCSQVLLKVTKVILRNGEQAIETFAILDDGSERTILLQAAAQKLKLQGEPEDLALRTVRQDMRIIHGTSVSFTISPACQPQRVFKIHRAFTADQLGLAEHTCPAATLQNKYRHLRGLPIPSFDSVRPLLLIGSDYPHLVTPIEPVRLGPPGGPAAVKTRLGWTVQGPAKLVQHPLLTLQCLNISIRSPSSELFRHIEKLWQLDVLPYRSEKLATRSKQDQEAIDLLEAKTTRIDIKGTQRYATPLLRIKNMPKLHATKQAVMPNLRSTENRLAKDPAKLEAYRTEIQRLIQAGYVVAVPEEKLTGEEESWFIPHHMVSHNGKNRVVFNCSFSYRGENLNDLLLPGPTLGSSLLGVLLRFREHPVAFSSDIKGMFHQVRLLPEDKPLLRFLWRDLNREEIPSIYEWQVLPLGTTCSPCCATYALQKHVVDHSEPGDHCRHSIERCFYVDNCLQSVATPEEAKGLVNTLRNLLAEGGFELRQWACNSPNVINHLPLEARSESSELWLNQTKSDPQELALGLRWMCQSDTLGYQSRLADCSTPTMRNIYKVVASQYDPLGFLVPYITRAKILIQSLWAKQREWDDPLLPNDILQTWHDWQRELPHLTEITLPRCYVSSQMDSLHCSRQVHIFSDASEQAYGSVAYLRTEDPRGGVKVSFLTARSRVAPKRQLSVPRLELCAALTGAQLASLLAKELTLNIESFVLWTDSTTVLTWLQSESCRYKVFVGTRIAEIQELTSGHTWRYVESANNPADYITHGKTLKELATDKIWRHGPECLLLSPSCWPIIPKVSTAENPAELKKATFCSHLTVADAQSLPDPQQFSSFKALVEAAAILRHGAAGKEGDPSAEDHQLAERDILRKSQCDSFPEDFHCLVAGKPVPYSSRLLTLAPEYDHTVGLIRVGGRLRHSQQLDADIIHPVVLDPSHKITQLLIQNIDKELHHPGSERVFAEIRRKYWILRGREAVKRQQFSCPDCQRWRAKPTVPRMADLPQARLQILKPPFFSTGMDCFGPFTVKIGRRCEKTLGHFV
ncbi:uncharacterized protein [Pseudorasbora parva]|uniref:uncharacterized protein n=1 Tax=Pseudorasbora parva TaxID=51549 RepID=UPI00351F6F51